MVLPPERPSVGFSDDRLADLVIETGASVLVIDGDEVRAAVLDLPIEVVACLGDPTSVDLALAAHRGVTVLSVDHRDAEAVAELTLALVIADREVRRGRVFWDGSSPVQRHSGLRLAGCTFGIIGLGRVGSAVAWRARGIGMRVIACDPFVAEATHTLPQLLAEADVVSLHVPVTRETMSFIGDAELAAMRTGAIYLNTSRGALHDLAALVDALRSGKLGGAGLDHFEGEWLDPTHPLTMLENVVLTPRLGEATEASRNERTEAIMRDLARVLRGETPEHVCTAGMPSARPA